MIDVKIDGRGGIERFEACGPDLDIVAEIGCIVSLVYAKTKAINPRAAEQFRVALSIMFLPESPVWTCDPIKCASGVSAVIPVNKRGEGAGQ